MILVDSSGNDLGYRTLEHAPWNGMTLADLVFPSFLLIMGMSTAISLGRHMDRGEPNAKLLRQALWRTLAIFSLGMLINLILYSPSAGLRLPGVLQRISICYFFCALVFMADSFKLTALTAAALLLGYWLLMTCVPVPGFGRNVLSPEGNWASYLDRRILGGHLYKPLFDPEGLLSTLPALATSLFGVMTGRWLRIHDRLARKASVLLWAGLLAVALGWIWSRWFPLNKHLWTSSYALVAGGLSLWVFVLCYWLIDIFGLTAWTKPFVVFGINPLASYFLSGLFYGLQEFIKVPMPDGSPGNLKLRICASLFGSWLSPPNAALAYAVSYVLVCVLFMSILHRKKLFLRV